MPVPTPFHPRTLALCESLSFRDWSGFYAPSSYESHHEHEYHAIRQAAALIDVSPLFKYLVTGPDATRLVDRVIARDATRVAVGQVIYAVWCDEHGYVVDDGTLTRVAESAWRWTAADPTLRWLRQNAAKLDVVVEDITEKVAALAVQGPTSGAVLRRVAGPVIERLAYYRATDAEIAGVPVSVSRTGYTGDLGYEIWIPADRALAVWDALMREGRAFGIRPAGMLALDVARIEAGLLLIDVDYHGARKAQTAVQRYTPYELGLGRLVQTGASPFVGRAALVRLQGAPPARQIVGLEISWEAVEALFAAAGLPPQAPSTASRVPVPVYRGRRQIGRATSTTWSPVLKRLLALATLDAPHYAIGTRVEIETTVEAVRYRVPAQVVRLPQFKPDRKTATPPPFRA
jgi:aminomethyltransferase